MKNNSNKGWYAFVLLAMIVIVWQSGWGRKSSSMTVPMTVVPQETIILATTPINIQPAMLEEILAPVAEEPAEGADDGVLRVNISTLFSDKLAPQNTNATATINQLVQ